MWHSLTDALRIKRPNDALVARFLFYIQAKDGDVSWRLACDREVSEAGVTLTGG
jgi:hypothetical protein